MGRKKNKQLKWKVQKYNLAPYIPKAKDYVFIPKTDHIYDEEKELYSPHNRESNYYYEYVTVYECLACKKKFKDKDTISRHIILCDGTGKGYRQISHKIKRLKYRKYD